MRIIILIVGIIPWRLRQSIGYALGWCIGSLPLRETRIAKLQFERFGPTNENSTAATRQIFGHCGATVLESFALKPILQEAPSCISCTNWDSINFLLANGKGLIALTAHYSNWELLAAYVAAQNIELTVIGKETRQSYFQDEIARIRKSYGVKTVWRDSSSLARGIIADLNLGSVVAALIDQDTDVKSTPIPFFGESAPTPSSLVRLALRRETPIIAAFIRRNKDYTFSVCITHLTNTSSVDTILLEYHQLLEKEIIKDPHQWVWFHKRWRTTVKEGRRSRTQYEQWLRKAK